MCIRDRDMGATGALVYHARGVGPRERLGLLGIAIEAEKEVVSILVASDYEAVSYTHLRAHETVLDLVCRLLLEKKKTKHHNK